MNSNYKDMKKALKYPFRKPCEKPVCMAISAIFAEKSTMKITFTYKRRSYNYEAEIVTLEQNRQTIKACYPIGIKSEWIVLFGKKHSPLFYMDDGTPVLARYKTATGKDSFFKFSLTQRQNKSLNLCQSELALVYTGSILCRKYCSFVEQKRSCWSNHSF